MSTKTKTAAASTKTAAASIESLTMIATAVIDRTGEYRTAVESAGKTAAASILAADQIKHHDLCFGFFSAFYARKVQCEANKDETAAAACAAAWNAVKPSFGRAFAAAGYAINWPTIRDASGSLIIRTKTEAAAAKTAAKQQAADQHAAALQRNSIDNAIKTAAALRESGPDDVTASLLKTLRTWSSDLTMQLTVVRSVLKTIEEEAATKTAAAAKRKAAAAKRKAAAAAKRSMSIAAAAKTEAAAKTAAKTEAAATKTAA